MLSTRSEHKKEDHSILIRPKRCKLPKNKVSQVLSGKVIKIKLLEYTKMMHIFFRLKKTLWSGRLTYQIAVTSGK